MSISMVEQQTPESVPPSDESLLTRYINDRDEAAFRKLVERHAALVLSVCRRGAPSPADADDAFQATFIVLAKNAHKVRKPASLAAWLYGVAYRVSVRLRREMACRKTQPLVDSMVTYCDPLDELLARHEQAITDEELAALPESLRTPLVLRYLAGHTNVEVAEKLGTSVSAVEGRLKRAKQRLRSRLIRRGVALTTAVMILKATRVAADEVPQSLVHATLEICFGTGAAAAGAAAASTNATVNATASASAQSTAIQLAHQEVLAMNAFIFSKPLAAAIVAGCVATLVVGVQYSPFTGQQAIAQRATPLNTGTPAEGGLTVGRDRTEPLGEIKVPAAAAVVQDRTGFAGLDIYDRKPRSDVEKQIAVALASTTSKIDFNGQPLESVAAFLSDKYSIPIQIDKLALEDAGLGPDEPITFSGGAMSFRSALRHILRQHALTYIVRDEVMLITTPTVAEEELETRVYPLDDAKSAKTLQGIIMAHVLTDTWAAGGHGTAEITGFSGGLVISQTNEGHELIHDLLKQLGWPSRAK